MADTDERRDTDAPVKQFIEKWWAWLTGYVKRKMQERAAKKKQETPSDRAARITATATVWMAIFTFALVLVTVGTLVNLKIQLREMRDATRLTMDNFRQVQRPYLWHAKSDALPVYTQPGQQVAWNFHIVNFGSSPAQHLVINSYITLGVGDPIPGFYNSPNKEAAPLPPGEDRYFTSGSDTKITEKEFNRLLFETNSIELHATISYSDRYGANYTTGVCIRHLATGATAYCENGNYIK